MRKYIIAAVVALTVLASTPPAVAEPTANEYLPVAFSGFGTFGVAHTQGDGAGFIRDMAQPKGANNRGLSWELDTRIGVQANLKPAENLEAVAQIVSRYSNENNFKPELTWGFLKYTLNEAIEVRAGRIGFDAFLSADSRDIGYSYLWIRPPSDYYGSLFLSYEDGGDVIFRMPMGKGLTRLKLYSGITRGRSSSLLEQREWAGNISSGPIGSVLDMNGSRGQGGFIDYQDRHWIARVGIARLHIAKDFPAGSLNMLGLIRSNANQAFDQDKLQLSNALVNFANDASVANKQITFKSIALAYEDGPLQTQMALSRITADSLMVANSRAGYVSAGYRLGKLTPYSVISFVKSKRSDRSDELIGLASDRIVSLTNFMLSAPLTNQTTYSIGVRYAITDNAALKFQMDMIRNNNCSPVTLPVVGPGTSCAPPRFWTNVPVSWNGRANVYSAVLDFAF